VAVILAALAPPAAALDEPPSSGPRAVTLAVTKASLANGLEVILHEDHRTPIVTVNLWYHVGSKDEPPGKNGFAHLFEHVMFQGSKHVPEDTYFRDLERAGATSINGSTALDRTNYFETVPKNRLDLALWLESDRMGFLLDHVDQATFAGQRDVVLNERRQSYENAPYGMIEDYLCKAIYPVGHPYHLLTIGSPEDLHAATLDDVKNFFRTWYVPNNATLVISGDIDPADALARAEKYFGPIPSGTVPDRSRWTNPPPVTLAGQKVLDVAAAVELPRVYMAWPTPPIFKGGDGDLDLASEVLTGGKTSRLYKRLVYDMQIAESVTAYEESHQLGSKFVIVATAQPGKSPEALRAAIDEELRRFSQPDGAVTSDELERARAGILSELLFNLERDSARANTINSYNQLAHDPAYLAKDIERYKNATTASVTDAIRQWLPLDRRVVAVVRPDPGAPVSGVLREVDGAPPPVAAPSPAAGVTR
jgi:predicted Zn-dependent peptidase